MKQFSKTDLAQWQLDLIDKYPLVFSEPDEECVSWYLRENPEFEGKTLPDDYCNLRYGFEHNKGWASLIEEYAAAASELVSDLRFQKRFSLFDCYIHSCIWKEKFGVMDIQGNINLPPLYRKLWREFEISIERKSVFMCELSGKPGNLCTKGGWLKTLSKEKQEELGYERSKLRA